MIFATHPDDPGEPGTGQARIGIADDEYRLLRYLAYGRKVLEIGTGLGNSVRAMWVTAVNMHTIDIDPWVQETIWPTLPDAVTRHTSRIEASMKSEVGTFGLVFVDGAHDPASVQTDLDFAHTMRTPNGLIVFHDTDYVPEIRPILDRSGFEWLYLPTTFGLGLHLQ